MADRIRIAAVADLTPNSLHRFLLPDGRPIFVAALNGAYYAGVDTCTHAQASLSEGQLVDGCVECPRHGSQFDLATGAVRNLPATEPIRTYPVSVDGDSLYLELSETP